MDSTKYSVNYDELDKVLDEVAELLWDLAKEESILGATLERWRWDEPDITLTWRIGDMRRNIHVLLIPEGEKKFMVEVNAWWDEDLEEGRVRVRHWDNSKVAEDLHLGKLRYSLMQEAYNTVSRWERYKLTRVHHLNSKAVGR